MTDDLQWAKSSEKNDDSGESASTGLFKWFVLVTYIMFSSSLGMVQIIFDPVPNNAFPERPVFMWCVVITRELLLFG